MHRTCESKNKVLILFLSLMMIFFTGGSKPAHVLSEDHDP